MTYLLRRCTSVLERMRAKRGFPSCLQGASLVSTVGTADRESSFRRSWGEAARDDASFAAQTEGETYPLPLAQEQIQSSNRPTYGYAIRNVSRAFEIRGELDAEALRGALAALTARNEILRCEFVERDACRMMRERPDAALDLVSIDLADRREELQSRMSAEARVAFNLGRAPLSRATLYHLGAGRQVLQMTFHGLIGDRVTHGLLVRDLGRLYEAIAFESTEPETMQGKFGDFALCQQGVQAGPTFAEQSAFWNAALALPRAVAEFPADHPRAPLGECRGAWHWQRIDPHTAEAAKALGREHGASPFETFAAAYMTILNRYSGEPDVVVGFSSESWPFPETNSVGGTFAHKLALRADFSDDPNFETLLERVRDFSNAADDNKQVSLEELAEGLRGESGSTRVSLFSTMIDFVECNRGTFAIRGLDIVPLYVDAGIANVDLTLELVETEDGLVARFEYDRNLFDATTVERIGKHYSRMLESVTRDPRQRLSHVRLLDEPERKRILQLGEGDFTRPAPDRPLHELFEAQVDATPTHVALEFADDRIVYAELNARANLLARELQAVGVAPGDAVGVCVDRSPELIVALLGVLKSGAAFLPLDRAFPADRLQFMLDQTRASVVVTRSTEAAALEGFTGQLLLLDAPTDGAERDAGNLGVSVAPEALAYVLYTSGSTGRPKGVMIPQGALVNHMLWMLESGLVTPDDRALQKTPISFDVALWECFAPLLVGATIVLAEPDAHRDPRRLVDLIEKRGITVVGFVPSMLRYIVDEPKLTRCRTLRCVFAAGEALPLEVARQFAARSAAELHNLYGPTETTLHSTAWRFDTLAARVLIGRPISRTRVYVLDSSGDLAPLGVAGELCIGGSGVGLGYLAREDLTAAAFVTDRFCGTFSTAAPVERMYRTGDLARLLPDGTIDCLGRRDRQVKIRGLRIELGEIEAVIASFPDVREVAMVTRDLGEAGPTLAAYVVMHAAKVLDVSSLRAQASKLLPEYMVPGLWFGLDELPKTVSGKVDYRVLPTTATVARVPSPAKDAAGPNITGLESAQSVAPLTKTERHLASIWKRLLGTGHIGRLDDFSRLGGNSLLVLRMAAEIEREFGKRLPLESILIDATLAQVAIAIDAGATEELSPVTALNHGGSQQPFIFFHNLKGGSAYCRKIAEGMGPDQPFYAIDPQSSRGILLESIEAMAADYLPLVRSIQPHGPYRLGGFCNGGFVAYELARLLVSEGEIVEHLVIINAAVPSSRVRWIDAAIRAVARERWLDRQLQFRICYFLAVRLRPVLYAYLQGPGAGLGALRDQFGISPPPRVDDGHRRLTARSHALRLQLKRGLAALPSPRGWMTAISGESEARSRARIGRAGKGPSFDPGGALASVEFNYHPKPLAGTLILMWGEEERNQIMHDETMGWGALARGVRVIPIPGDHMSGFRNAGARIGERLREEFAPRSVSACLDEREFGLRGRPR